MEQNNKVKVYTSSLKGNLEISVSGMKQTVEATNNRARLYAEQSLKYRDEAKKFAENAQYYAEQNSDVSIEDLVNLKAELQREIETKQDFGDYALRNELPTNISELNNDANYVNHLQLLEKVPEQTGHYREVLTTNGENSFWSKISTYKLFDCKLSDHILSSEESKGWALQGTYVYKEAIAGSRYGYPDFYAKCLEEYNEASTTETINGVTVKVHSNGHKFYDIADKTAIDEIFSSTGMAWFYGIDTENERIFLPRRNILNLTPETKINVYGDGNGLSFSGYRNSQLFSGPLMSHYAQGGLAHTQYIAYGSSNLPIGSTVGSDGVTGLPIQGDTTYRAVGVSTKEALGNNSSGLVADLEDISTNQEYLYICVGNIEAQSAITDVVDITTTENDTIPLGYSTYQNGTQPSISWLKSQGQWNEGNVYTTFYNEFVQKIGQNFASGKVVEVTDAYTDYDLVINQDDMTFRLPLLDGSEDIIDSSRYIDYTSELQYHIAPANGYVFVEADTETVNNEIGIYIKDANGNMVYGQRWQANTAGMNQMLLVPVTKGYQFCFDYETVGEFKYYRFYYNKGNGSLYFKVANAVQNLELLNAGEVLEAVNNIVPNNSSLIAGYGMPSNKYIDLTLGASGTTYTAPANGYFVFSKIATIAGQFLRVTNETTKIESLIVTSVKGQNITTWVPASKGDVVSIGYDLGGTGYSRFIYAEGDK